MKLESQLILNTDKKLILQRFINNLANLKQQCYFHVDFELDSDSKFELKEFDDVTYKVFNAQDIIQKFDGFFLALNDIFFQQEFTFGIYDDFSSYTQMFTNFTLEEPHYCFNLNFYDVVYDTLYMNPQRFPIDSYYFIENAYTLDICTTIQNPDDTIYDTLALMLGLTQKNDFGNDLSHSIVNFKP